MKRIAIVFPIVLIASLLPLSPSLAEDRGKVVVAPEAAFTNAYPAITSASPPAVLYAQLRPAGCRDAFRTNCDTHTVDMAIPDEYEEIFKLEIILDWKGKTANNLLDLYVWSDDEDPVSGAPSADDESLNKPKRVELGEPRDRFFITVNNFRGLNDGYTLTFKWRVVDLGRFPEAEEPPDVSLPADQALPSTPSGLPEAGGSTDGFDSFDSEPVRLGPPPRKIVVPGADGELRAIELPVVARAGRSTAGSRGVDPLAAGIVFFVLAGAGAGAFVLIRRRRAQA